MISEFLTYHSLFLFSAKDFIRTSVRSKHFSVSEKSLVHISRKYRNGFASEGMERRPEQGNEGTKPLEHL